MERPKIESVSWKNGFPSNKVRAEDAHREMEKIRAKSGGDLTAEAVVESARNERSKLHPLFEWDDSEAARQHRLTQAKTAIRALEVTFVEAKGTAFRAYEIVTKGKPETATTPRTVGVYGSISEMMSDPAQRNRLINEAIAGLVQWRRKFAGLTELAAVFEAIDKAIKELSDMK